MRKIYVIKTLGVFCFALIFVYGGFLFTSYWRSRNMEKSLDQQYVFHVQKIKTIKSAHVLQKIVKVEININDDIETKDGKIISVVFAKHTLTLKPADPLGSRGTIRFQLSPGTYQLIWKVRNNDKNIWPKFTEYRKKIKLYPEEKWIHIRITGRKYEIDQVPLS